MSNHQVVRGSAERHPSSFELLKSRYGLQGIALSGFGMEEDVRRSREAGFELHLTKPVAPQALADAIERVGGDQR
jgi:CheY-like chemotaxis protein